MGEDAWIKHQKERNKKKSDNFLSKPEVKRKVKIVRRYHASEFRRRLKQKLIDYKGGKCYNCGYNKNIQGAYDFHHVNPKDKKFTISTYKIVDFKKLKKEVDKCILVCKNCHAEIHDAIHKEDMRKIKTLRSSNG